MKMSSKPNVMPTYALICGLAGGVWAIVGGIGVLVIIIGRDGLLPAIVVELLFLIILMGVLALVAIAQFTKRPRLSLMLIWGGTIGVITVFSVTQIAILFPSAILLIPAAVSMSVSIRRKTSNLK